MMSLGPPGASTVVCEQSLQAAERFQVKDSLQSDKVPAADQIYIVWQPHGCPKIVVLRRLAGARCKSRVGVETALILQCL